MKRSFRSTESIREHFAGCIMTSTPILKNFWPDQVKETVHLQDLEKLLLEVFKSLHQINPAFMWELFERKEVNYNLRNKDLLRIPKFQTITYGANSISYRGSYLWNSLPDVVKSCERVLSFKRKLREWNGRICTCRVCK